MSARSARLWLVAGGCALAMGAGEANAAGLFGKAKPAPAAVSAIYPVSDIQRAIDEQRLLDAGKMLDRAFLAGDQDPQLKILSGQLNLARGRYENALANYKSAEADPAVRGEALEGQGLALSMMQRSDEALAMLKTAVAAKPDAWRAWNALGSEYDARKQWPQADAAYERAIADSNRAAIVLNNRGFSRLLQARADDAIKDFVEALQKKPDLVAARTNLRLAIAMQGEYDRAIAGAPQDSEAATLNNAGFAAMMRGDYAAAEGLFERAMQAKGEYYGRAASNLQLARSLKSQTEKYAGEAKRAP